MIKDELSTSWKSELRAGYRLARRGWQAVFSTIDGRLRREAWRNAEIYCMFLGYPRSGHSLVGALLNAHPRMAIAHELDALEFVSRGYSRDQLFSMLLARDRWFNGRRGGQWTGYTYSVPDQWQGRFDRLLVIGDKKGGASALRLYHHPELMDRLAETVQRPIRIIHHVRNPFDVIATHWGRKDGRIALGDLVEEHFQRCEAVLRLMQGRRGDDILTMRHETFRSAPKDELERAARFLVGDDIPDGYLDACAAIVLNSDKRTRGSAPWTDQLIDEAQLRIERYPFLEGYNFAA